MIALGCDHGGYELKLAIIEHLKQRNTPFLDFGAHSTESCDYPDYAQKACEAVVDGRCEKAILICGTGIGISMAANKIKGIRAAACSEHFSAKHTRLHNDANALCLGGRVIGAGTACELVDLFLDTAFEGGRHQARVDKMTKLEHIEKGE